MPLRNYGVLKGRPIQILPGTGPSPHVQILMVDDTTRYRIAVNVKSKLYPSELLYLMVDDFQHPVTEAVAKLPDGFNPIAGDVRRELALDFVRANLFQSCDMKPLPHAVGGDDNDLNEKLTAAVQRAIGDETATLYAFGERWGPEPDRRDKYFGFLPGNGIHDIHMNQGNSARFTRDDGPWQDGSLLIELPGADGVPDRWIGIFLAFQSQSWHTDDETGHRITATDHCGKPLGGEETGGMPTDVPDGRVQIVAALVNPEGGHPEREIVTLINPSPADIDLDGWRLGNKAGATMPLAGVIAAGKTREVQMDSNVPLSNRGGKITLLDAAGLKVHGVAYSRAQARRSGWTLVF